MSVAYEVLGAPGQDNALLVRIDSGQAITRLLFDCGEGCLNGLPFSELQSIDELFFSHLHMDHVGGFDHYFRSVFNREAKPNRIWGPPSTARILQHRFQGFLWNLHAEMNATWRVIDINDDHLMTTRFELSEAFARAHQEGVVARQPTLCQSAGYTVEAYTMDHRTPAIAYVVREQSRHNIDMPQLAKMGLRPGPWMKQLKDPSYDSKSVSIDETDYSTDMLRKALLVETKGDSIAYLTDFLLDEEVIAQLSMILKGCTTIVCEGQYRHADLELARKNYHMTTALSAQLAHRAEVGKLILFHLSDRYTETEWTEMLLEAQQHFAATSYPSHWQVGQIALSG